MSDEAHWLTDPVVWYAASVAIFVAGAVVKGRKPILGWLDSEIAKVREELAEAKKLREEAAATLEDYRRRQQAAMQEAGDIIARAKEQAERLREEAQNELKATLARYENKAAARIRMAEAEAMDEVRAVVIEQALATARKTLAAKVDSAVAKRLVDQAIEEIPRLSVSGGKSA